MKTLRALALVTILSFAGVVMGVGEQDAQLVAQATNLKTLHRVTETPHAMLDSTATLCRPPFEPDNLHEGFRNAAYCHVYVNDLAKPTMQSGRGKYPVGSLIVKSKLPAKDKPDIELFTVMRKMADGFDSEKGNWEYSVIDGRSNRVHSRGKIDSCISCHTAYRETDFVTRTYMKQK